MMVTSFAPEIWGVTRTLTSLEAGGSVRNSQLPIIITVYDEMVLIGMRAGK
jgi:hypothetical protein